MNNGQTLLDHVEAQFKKYTVQQSEHEYAALALYVAYTHVAGAFDYAPRLVITSAEKRSGKTITLTVISNLVNRALLTANASTAAVFRSLAQANEEGHTLTLCFDEADTVFGLKVSSEKTEELRGLLNAGFQRGTPTLRVVGIGTAQTVQKFDVFSPAILCGIGSMPDTITDRAINIRLRRAKADERTEDYRIRKDEPLLHDVRTSLQQWAEEHQSELSSAPQPKDTPLRDRAADTWEPLLMVAHCVGGDWVAKANAAAVHLTQQAEQNSLEPSTGIELLGDIREVLSLVKGSYVETQQLLSLLQSMELSRWSEEPVLTPRKLSELLKPYQVFASRLPGGKKRGYKLELFQDAFSRYLTSPSLSVTPSQPLENTGQNGVTDSNTYPSRSVTPPQSTLDAPPLQHLKIQSV